ncbi:MAG: hypothetical protein HC836_33085 [Richelia sp. RM2_1_2]|nr:hypothetical protein [Richelia sp. RM2_1_2]
MNEEPIYDYNFSAGDKAQYVYINKSGEEGLALVSILDSRLCPDSKRYIVSIHNDILCKTDLKIDTFLNNHYSTELLNGYSAVYLYPDELIPYVKQFSVVVDNTRR